MRILYLVVAVLVFVGGFAANEAYDGLGHTYSLYWDRFRRDSIDDAGLPLIHLAIAFVMQHPAVTAPIIGPRTLDHLKSQIGAADVTLSAEILDKIDEIVPPGSTITRTDQGYLPPSLTNPFLRRRRSA